MTTSSSMSIIIKSGAACVIDSSSFKYRSKHSRVKVLWFGYVDNQPLVRPSIILIYFFFITKRITVNT